ncbi:ArsR/SmtB family transcription factor [Anaerosporobacter faecicola]|uniref:ArsR/SmtB family transcription factor n=1 Tax=Anaerosporobacter faecicola TaxID=2718714 RepID=UPI001EE5CA32|nr:ArsR family transcriptional regulator [Anaerosporobacter faecicola]
MQKTRKLNLADAKQVTLVGKALSSEVRLDIIRLLQKQEYNINEIAETLKLAPSSAASHIRVLEEAGIIRTTLLPGIRGSMKLCSLQVGEVYVNLGNEEGKEEQVEIIHMPIGNYVDYRVTPTCGLVSLEGPIDEEDEPRCFYNPDRVHAKLLWLGDGYVEYRFPNNSIKSKEPKRIEISAELCSEDHDFNMDYPSDITLWINGIEAATWECPSDFGGRRGRLNPEWWPDKNTQYGMLKTWEITSEGVSLDGEKISSKRIGEFGLTAREYIAVRFGVKEETKHKGGMNLFGNGFGDYEQDIIMKIYK